MKHLSYQNFGMSIGVVGSNSALGNVFFQHFKNAYKIFRIAYMKVINTNGTKQSWNITEIVIKNKEIKNFIFQYDFFWKYFGSFSLISENIPPKWLLMKFLTNSESALHVMKYFWSKNGKKEPETHQICTSKLLLCCIHHIMIC